MRALRGPVGLDIPGGILCWEQLPGWGIPEVSPGEAWPSGALQTMFSPRE